MAARTSIGAAAFALLATVSAGASEKQATYVVSVTNHRTSAVQQLAFAATGAEHGSPNLLKHPLAHNATVKVHVRGPEGVCSFVVAGLFADGTEVYGEGLNLCVDRTVSLVD